MRLQVLVLVFFTAAASAQVSIDTICNESKQKRCPDIEDCSTALFYLNKCELKKLDLDNDGIPCEAALCKELAALVSKEDEGESEGESCAEPQDNAADGYFKVELVSVGRGVGLLSGSGYYPENASVCLNAQPTMNSRFIKWQCSANGSSALHEFWTHNIRLPAKPMTCAVTFNPPDPKYIFDVGGLAYATDKAGRTTKTSTIFELGVIAGTDTVTTSENVSIRANIWLDVADMGETLELLVTAVHSVIEGYPGTHYTINETRYAINKDGTVLPWNGEPETLPYYKRITPSLGLVEIEIYNGPLLAGSLYIQAGYRLQNGTIVYSPHHLLILVVDG